MDTGNSTDPSNHPQLIATTETSEASSTLRRIMELSTRLRIAVETNDRDTFIKLYEQRRPMIQEFDKEHAPQTWQDTVMQYSVTLHHDTPSGWMEELNEA